ncbi:peptidase S1 [Legionella taurinensis]|uniref:Peptidase S1 n=2 Tax=Legionella taurinensis TaxID=70611 RepID=A0A3A5LBU7_9GAMM|nr:peptidase S1 [Legionella taurinensis]PUT40139.1 peptidase S1 [Legionella taurinensis]PUT42291.1 peptidase S1 [Legionella taurinensis]PUT46062.1 peptidase S1 [Legionella taurinensis]RJT48821.1 peptidase S1 [Legionella taurinensis]
MTMLSAPGQAVIILDSTFKKSGFQKAESLALSPQFASLLFLDGESASGSGAWIGNYQGHGYVLTAGHLFPPGTKASDYRYLTLDGTVYQGDRVFIHPLWNENHEDRTGYDVAIVRLTSEVTDAGPQPALYSGSAEKGQQLTFMGYGWRGTGKKGEDTSIDTGNRPAAAVGLIESVENAVHPVPEEGDAGNYLGVWLPKEDGSLANPLDDEGIIKPFSPLAGILGSGDSGGPAWIKTNKGWSIAAVSSDGSGNAAYGDVSWFSRVTGLTRWIKQIVPTARFVE